MRTSKTTRHEYVTQSTYTQSPNRRPPSRQSKKQRPHLHLASSIQRDPFHHHTCAYFYNASSRRASCFCNPSRTAPRGVACISRPPVPGVPAVIGAWASDDEDSRSTAALPLQPPLVRPRPSALSGQERLREIGAWLASLFLARVRRRRRVAVERRRGYGRGRRVLSLLTMI